MVPDLDNSGLLPEGVWDCTLEQVQHSFCSNHHRSTLWDGLLRFIDDEVRPLGNVVLWINGSFTRLKDMPDDIDVVIDVTGWDDKEATKLALSFWMRRVHLKDAYQVDAWVKHPSVPNDLSLFFQYAGPKAAAELQVDEKQAKGILRVRA